MLVFWFQLLAYSFSPVKSIATTGSFPTTHALCPGGITPVSPGPNSSTEPSSITTFNLPEIKYCVCGASQLFVLTIGFTHFSQLQPGSKTPRPMITSPRFARSILPFSNVRVSSGEELRFFFCIFVDGAMTELRVV